MYDYFHREKFPNIPVSLVSELHNYSNRSASSNPPGGGGVLPYMGYIGMCGPKGYGFSAVLVIDRVSILVNVVHFGHKWGMIFAL